MSRFDLFLAENTTMNNNTANPMVLQLNLKYNYNTKYTVKLITPWNTQLAL